MNRVFVVADTHFGHTNILGFEPEHRAFPSIKDHDEALIDAWNATVNKKDTVWHLGDVLFGREAFALLPRLNGVKKLVMGNHDHYPSELYLSHFNKIYGAAKLKDFILTHVPVHPDQFYRFKGNIHGHTHSKSLSDPRYVCVSVEQTGFKPQLLTDAIDRWRELN